MGATNTVSLADAQVRRLEVLAANGDTAAEALVNAYRLGPDREGGIDETTFLARAAGLKSILRGVDVGGALMGTPAVRLASSRGISIPDHTYAQIFGSSDRGRRVTATQAAIEGGEINATEVLNA